MKRKLTVLSVCAALCATGAKSAPCVGNGFDVPFPGATDVVVLRKDIPSAQFPGVWQEGRADGFAYRLFANGDGDVMASDPSEWRIGFQCLKTDDGCSSTTNGTPPETAILLANRLQSCLLGEDPSKPEIVEPVVAEEEPEETEVEEPVATPVEVSEPEPCGVALLADVSDEIALQELLAMGGANPGPIDGIIGGRTREALRQLTNLNLEDVGVPDAIVALDALLCRAQD